MDIYTIFDNLHDYEILNIANNITNYCDIAEYFNISYSEGLKLYNLIQNFRYEMLN